MADKRAARQQRGAANGVATAAPAGPVDLEQPLPAGTEHPPTLASAAEVALADLEHRVSLGMGPVERALAARIREAVAQLRDCSRQLAGEELMIPGSTGQQRPHPLLKTLAELRREISDGLKELSFRAEQRAMFERIKAAQELGSSPQPEDTP